MPKKLTTKQFLKAIKDYRKAWAKTKWAMDRLGPAGMRETIKQTPQAFRPSLKWLYAQYKKNK